MKRKFAAIVIAMCMFLSSAFPAFAAEKLSRPVIDGISAKKSSIVISWGAVESADGYYVYRATSKDGNYSRITETNKISYRDSDIKKGKKYYYKVRAVSDGEYKNSSLSNWRSAKIKKSAAVAQKPTASSGDSIVYITETGSKYHHAGCRFLRSSSIQTTLDSALNRGYSPCASCC